MLIWSLYSSCNACACLTRWFFVPTLISRRKSKPAVGVGAKSGPRRRYWVT